MSFICGLPDVTAGNSDIQTYSNLTIMDLEATVIYINVCYPRRLYTTIILSAVLYGCETWSLTLREENKLRVFENRAPRRIFGPNRDGVTGGWGKLHNEKLHNLYS
jgi:hypothetical protein